MKRRSLVFRYTFFALLATLANLATQRSVLWLGENNTLFTLAVFAGTLIGLLLKYILDKRWIFHDKSMDLKSHTQQFSLYTAIGVFTTLVFWGIEACFWLIWKTTAMRELGAIIGLGIGYVLKYRLDYRFVFNASNQE